MPKIRNPKPPKRPKKVWKRASQVEQVTFTKSNGKKVKIGEGNYGEVFVGRLKFKEGAVHRVAIKQFKKDNLLDNSLAKSYQRTIRRLRVIGIPIPKMSMIKIKTKRAPEGEWVQVSQLWGSVKQGSKFIARGKIVSPKGRTDSVEILTKLANSGYLVFLDMIEPIRMKPGAVPIDIDKFVPRNQKEMRIDGINKGEDIARNLYGVISYLASNNLTERRRLLRVAMKEGNNRLREEMRKLIRTEK